MIAILFASVGLVALLVMRINSGKKCIMMFLEIER